MQDVALIGLLVIVIWGAALLWRGGPLAGCLLFMLAASCFSADFLLLEAGAARLTVDRIFWLLVMLQCLVWSRQGWNDPKPPRTTDVVLLLFVGYLALRTFTADWRADNSAPLMHLILWYVMPLGIYWTARQSRLSPRASQWILACLTVFGVYLAFTLIAEYLQAYWLVYPKYIVDSMTVKDAEFVGRGRGPLLHPIISGIVLAVCWSASLLWWPHWGRARRAALVALSLVFAVAAVSTMTRSVWMGAGLSLAIVVGAGMPRHWRIPALGGGLLAAVLLTAVFWDQVVAFKRDRNLTAKETASSVYVRPVMARIAWNMFVDRPLFGCGFDQFLAEHKYYLDDRSTNLVLEMARGKSPHNLLLGILTETGIVGLGLFLAVLGLWARDGWRLWRTASVPLVTRQQGLLFLAALAAYLVNGMFHHVGLVPMSNLLLFFLAGTAEGLLGREVLGSTTLSASKAAPGSGISGGILLPRQGASGLSS